MRYLALALTCALVFMGAVTAELQNVDLGDGLRIRGTVPEAPSPRLLEGADWIGVAAPDDLRGAALLPAAQLRKEFTLDEAPRNAVLAATALGLYEIHINGQRVSDEQLAPGWTEYHKRIYCRHYDVTKLLKQGPNVIAVSLGDGWFGLHHQGRGKLRFMAKLLMEKGEVATDESWKGTLEGPIRHSDIYDGEAYDARRETAGWQLPGFDDSAWQPVVTGVDKGDNGKGADVTEKVRAAVDGGKLDIKASNDNFGDPVFGVAKVLVVEYREGGETKKAFASENQTLKLDTGATPLEIVGAYYVADVPPMEAGELEYHPGPPVRATQELKTAKLTEPKPGNFVFDFGQNFAGWARLKVSGNAGDTVKMRFAEMLNDDGTVYTANLRGADATDYYTLKGGGEEIWEPRFTFHGFRYVEVTGFPGAPTEDALTGVVVHSDMRPTGQFACSLPMLNQLYSNITWGMRSNYLEVPTDCPQRDERMGWSGDAQAFIGTAAYLYDIHDFFTAWMKTFNDSQYPDGGYPNVSPKGWGVSPAWGDAGIICPWTIWQRYGDTDMIREHYTGMQRWIAYLEERSDGLIRPAEGFGDWLNVNDDTPKEVISTAYFAYSTGLLAEMAEAIGKAGDAAKYRDLRNRIRGAFVDKFVSDKGKVKGDSQTAYLLALGFDLMPEELREAAADRLAKKVEGRDGHLSVGFLGVNLIMPVLTEIGRLDLAYGVLEKETYPSWGYSIAQGATTIWERWNSYTKEHGFGDVGMNSFNHYAYGSVGEWMFNTMLGIRAEGPGFTDVVIAPKPGGSLTYAEGSYDSIHGRIAVRWDKTAEGLKIKVDLPENLPARIEIPATREQQVSVVEHPSPVPTITDTTRCYEIDGGLHIFIVK